MATTTQNVDTSEAQPAAWPVWRRRDGRHAELARYVSPDALVAQLMVGEIATDAQSDRSLAEELYEMLRGSAIVFARERWIAQAARQQIRDPWSVIREGGNCLDLSVTYAAMCLRSGVGAMLALTAPNAPQAHAFVVLTPGRLHTNPGVGQTLVLPGCAKKDSERDGVTRLEDAAALVAAIAAGSVMAIDASEAAISSASFAQARARALTRITDGLVLVDVPWLQTLRGMSPHPTPASRPTIHLHVPGGQADFDEHDAHRELLTELSELSGTVVLIGPSGQGKSTIARQIALEAPFGAGWFLNASDPQALITSLAEAELSELNDPSQKLESADRGAYAQAARGRLSLSMDRWIVALDNADGEPTRLVPHLPSAGEDQLVLITTTNSDWERLPGLTIRHLPPIDDEHVASDLGGEEMIPLVAGRALLFYGFRRLMDFTGLNAAHIAKIAAGSSATTKPLGGPATLWAGLRDSASFDGDALAVSRHAALLPPDHQPAQLLADLTRAPSTAIGVLAAGGLLTLEQTGVVRMHRLFGAAVREDIERSSPAETEQAVLAVSTTPAALDTLETHGDLDTVNRLADFLHHRDGATADADERLGIALHAVAALMELQGHIDRSGELFALAERHLEARPDLLADSLHARARSVYRHQARDEERLRGALEVSRRASTIGNERAAGRYLAMQGLIMQKLAAFPEPGQTTVALLHDALEVIERADSIRRARTDITPAELARSHFNLAGIRIELAKVERRQADVHLDAAARVYSEVRDRRIRIFQRDIHAQIATCIIGLGYVNYYRATLTAGTPADRSAWLRQSTNHAIAAVRQYETQEGLVDLAESRKAARFLAKVALARHGPRARPRPAIEAVASEVVAELELAPVQPFPADGRGLVPAIDAWIRSPPLAHLVEAFDGELPQGGQLGDLLEWLEAFSARWDYRGGQERNLVAAQGFAPALAELITRCAHALGLVGMDAPAFDHYDHVLILGGLVRACFARPLHAARLLESGQITASNVTALGGYRPLRGDENDLAATFGHTELADEFDAMDTGVRQAFALDEPAEEWGETGDAIGAAWHVRKYAPAPGMSIHVVAAPSSEPGVRRANTADTYEWFASKHAHLSAGQRILIITTDIYVRYQHADALRMLTLRDSVAVDAVGIQPGELNPLLTQEFAPHQYLQEIRSTIRALRALHTAATGRN